MRSSIDDILSLIDAGADPVHLLDASVEADSPELHAQGIEEHGSWEAAVAAALIYVRRAATDDGRGAPVTIERPDAPRPERRVTPAAHVPLFAIGRSGLLFHLDLDEVRATADAAWQDAPPGPGREHVWAQLVLGGDDPGLVVLTDRGNALGVDMRLFPEWSPDAIARPLAARFGDVARDEVVACVLPRRALRDASRLFTVSVFGQVKATDTPEFKKLSADAMTGLLLRDGDALFSAFVGSDRSRVFVGSSAGKGLCFDTGDLRSQGRKATGVRALTLDPDARVVGAFCSDDVEWVLLVTEQGFMKRMRLDEFRPQGRAGGGLQTCKLAPGDHVASMCAAALDGDVIVVSSRGRVARLPVYEVPFAGRAARGEKGLELTAGETIAQVIGVPAGNWVA